METILEVGGSGGSVTICRWETSPGHWMWAMITNEVTLYDLLNGEEGFDSREAVKHQHAYSFEDAMKRLAKYPWPELEPIALHPQYRDAVLKAVLDRSGAELAERWREMTDSISRFNRYMT